MAESRVPWTVPHDGEADPNRSLIRMNDGPRGDALADHRHRSTFAPHYEWKRPAADFAGDNDNLPLAGLFLGQAPVNAAFQNAAYALK